MNVLNEHGCEPSEWLVSNVCEKGCLLKWVLTTGPALMADNVIAGGGDTGLDALQSDSNDESLDEEQ